MPKANKSKGAANEIGGGELSDVQRAYEQESAEQRLTRVKNILFHNLDGSRPIGSRSQVTAMGNDTYKVTRNVEYAAFGTSQSPDSRLSSLSKWKDWVQSRVEGATLFYEELGATSKVNLRGSAKYEMIFRIPTTTAQRTAGTFRGDFGRVD